MTPPSRRELVRDLALLLAAAPLVGCAPAMRGALSAARSGPTRVVVVGSGITGLVGGAILAGMGHEVVVLEAHESLLGGQARTMEIDGYRFCTGPQYVWSFESGDIGDRVLERLGLRERVKFDRLDPSSFERIMLGRDKSFDIPMGLDAFRAKMIASFPGDAGPLGRFFDFIGDVYGGAKVIFDDALYLGGLATMADGVLSSSEVPFASKASILEHRGWSLGKALDRFGVSAASRRVIYGHGGIFAENVEDVSVVLYAAATGYYHAGSRFPREGFDHLFRELAAVIVERGGRVLSGHRVSGVEVTGGSATAVTCTNGARFECGLVWSTLSPRLTSALVPGARAEFYRYAPSNTLVGAYLGTDHPEVERLLKLRNVWWQDDTRPVDYKAPDMRAPPTMLYLGSPSANRAAVGGAPGQRDCITVFSPGNYDQAVEAAARSEADHDALRAELGERILDQIDANLLPGIRGHLRTFRVETPLDIQRVIGAERGNVYGRRLDARTILAGNPRDPSLPGNLLVACASVGIPGIATGFQTAAHVIRDLTDTVI